jgi:GTP-binding protein
MPNIAAIVGRPNVGKSTLFNKLTGHRTAIVGDTPGVTRDRLFGSCDWLGRNFLLIDTGGIEIVRKQDAPESVLQAQVRAQADVAMESADVILIITDIKSGVTASDQNLASALRKSGKPVILVVNKCDGVGDPPAALYAFYALGLGEPYPVSSVHGHGTGDLLDAVCASFPPEPQSDATQEDDRVPVAIVGKPNTGKSSLVNALCGATRMIVADVAGTTRDAVDTVVENEKGNFLFIDTAGLRRHAKVYDAIERYAVLRAKLAIDRARVCVILIDATQGFTQQDSKVAGLAHEAGKACVIAVNKWDAVEKNGKTMQETRKKLMSDLAFMSYAPILFISAKTGQRLDRLYDLIKFTDEQNAMRISTGKLNEILADATARVQPPTDKGRRLKIYYITQPSTRPPTFVCFVNSAALFHYSYQRYLENQIRAVFGLEGTPLHLIVREREHT